MRIGTGSLGGKARGLAFANSYLGQAELREKYPQKSDQYETGTKIYGQ